MAIKLTEQEQEKIDSLLKQYKVIPVKKNFHKHLDWARALESGKYAQCQFTLKSDAGYCCLGVVSQISGLGKFVKFDKEKQRITFCSTKEQEEEAKNFNPKTAFKEPGEQYVLTDGVKKWLGIKDQAILKAKKPNYAGNKETRQFATLNDQEKLNFRQIAYIIRLSVKLGKAKSAKAKLKAGTK
jgi:hypothetical protein